MALLHAANSEHEIERTLETHFANVTWLGELDVDRDDYNKLVTMLRRSIRGQYRYMTIVAMVFTVRYAEYAEDETPNFWRKYAQMVWGSTEADAAFQNDERQRFRAIRDHLIDRFGFHFPSRAETIQDVVRGIYLHAILPSYLQDDFAAWLVEWFRRDKDWRRLVDAPLTAIQKLWQSGGPVSLTGVRRRLRHFLEREESAPTAARLVQTLAIAASEFLNGEDAFTVREMLSSIERDLWDQLMNEVEPLRQQASAASAKRSKGLNIRFAWHLAADTFGVWVKNWSTDGSAPDRLVWFESAEALNDYGQHFVSVNPWQTSSSWEVDSAFLPLPRLNGVIGLVDQDDQVLAASPLPSLPKDSLLFFKYNTDNTMAVLTPTDRISDGDYLIVSRATCAYEVRHAHHDHVITAHESFTLPASLQELGFDSAQQYNIKLPVNITLIDDRDDDRTIFVRNKRGAVSAVLDGETAFPSVSSAAYYRPPKLRIVNVVGIQDHIERLRLRVVMNDQMITDQYLSEMILNQDGDDLVIDLSRYGVTASGLYEIKLQRNFSPVLDDALTFALLPSKVRLTYPDPNNYYSYQHPFRVTIQGCTPEQVTAPHAEVQEEGEVIHVQWVNPLVACMLRLRLGEADIPFYFDVRWRHIWIEPDNKWLLPTDLDDTVIKAIGQRGDRFLLHVGKEPPRPLDLGASGSYAQSIANDPIYDMIRECPALRVPVYATYGQTTWPLFTVDNRVDNQFSTAAQQAMRSLRILKRRGQPHESQTHYEALVSLLALPRDFLDDVPTANMTPADLRNPFEMLKEVESLIPTLPRELVPELEMDLSFGDSCTLRAVVPHAPSKRYETRGKVMIARNENLVRPVDVVIKVADSGELLVHWLSERDQLLKCQVCGAVFLDDKIQRMNHSHRLGLKAPVPLLIPPDHPIEATLRRPPRLLGNWQLDFSSEYYNSARLESVRIGKSRAPSSKVSYLTLDHAIAAIVQIAPNQRRLEQYIRQYIVNGAETKPIGSLSQSVVESLSRMADSYLAARPLLSILSALMNKPLVYQWDRLAYSLIACAILYRAASRGQPQLTSLFEQHHEMTQRFLGHVFPLASKMMGWAWAWVELYMVYFDFVNAQQEIS